MIRLDLSPPFDTDCKDLFSGNDGEGQKTKKTLYLSSMLYINLGQKIFVLLVISPLLFK